MSTVEKTIESQCVIFDHSNDIVGNCEMLQLSLSALLESVDGHSAVAIKQANLLSANITLVDLIKESAEKVRNLV